MSHALRTPPAGFDEMTVDEQIDYVQALWDRIAAKEELVPVPEWHRAEIERRLAEYEADPNR
jgi:putative addiction module component (TIGR02574 family)